MENKFVDGLFVHPPTTKTPDWIKARLSFNKKFIKFIEDNADEKGWVNIDLCEKKGTSDLYAKLNVWKPTIKKDETVEEIPF